MKWFTRAFLCAALFVLTGSLAVWADKAPATQPAKPSRWGFAPYNKLPDVTDEQKAKINDIHRKANAARKAWQASSTARLLVPKGKPKKP